VDHIIPVVPETGFPTLPNGKDDWNTYLERYFCGPEGLQVLCDPCHDIKTGKENKNRKENRLTKKQKKDKM
jgi:hypothetical protein